MSKINKYVGARYVPLHLGDWDNTKVYEPLSVVTFIGASYTSKTYVPLGANINDARYWVCTGNYNAQVELYRQETAEVSSNLAHTDQQLKEVASILPVNVASGSDITTVLLSTLETLSSTPYSRLLLPKGNYNLSATIEIPQTIEIDLNGSIINLIYDINGFVINTESKLLNGEIKTTLATYSKSFISFKQNAMLVRDSLCENLTLAGLYGEGNLTNNKGVAIDLTSTSATTKLGYNIFNNIVIKTMGVGIRLKTTSVTGSWANANTFNNVRMEAVYHMVDLDSDYWGNNGATFETSGNDFNNFQLQFSQYTTIGLKITGSSNQFNGQIWDVGFNPAVGTMAVICNSKAKDNIVNMRGIPDQSFIDINFNANRVLHRKNIGSIDSFQKMALPQSNGFSTYTGEQDNMLAFADLEHTVTYSVAPTAGSTNPFRQGVAPAYWTSLVGTTDILIDLTTHVGALPLVGIVLDSGTKVTNITVTLIKTDNTEKIIGNISSNIDLYQLFENKYFPITSVKKIKISITANGYLGVTRIFAVSGANTNPFLSRFGGDVKGKLNFANGTMTMRSPNGTLYGIFVDDAGVLNTYTI